MILILYMNDLLSRSDAKKKLLAELQDLKVTSTTSMAKHSELQEAVKAYRSKAESYLSRLEQADIERAKAANGEAFSACLPGIIVG